MILKENSFYKLNDNGNFWYFKFKRLTNNNEVIADGYFINSNFRYRENISTYLCVFDSYTYEEIDISEIIDYLPNDNKDKIVYLRKQRIKSLLS